MTKTLISSLALAAAMSFSGLAYAQTMMNGMEIPADKLDEVQAQCDNLSSGNAMSTEANTDADKSSSDDSSTSTGSDQSTGGTPADATGSTESVSNLDVKSITLEDCVAAGLASGG